MAKLDNIRIFNQLYGIFFSKKIIIIYYNKLNFIFVFIYNRFFYILFKFCNFLQASSANENVHPIITIHYPHIPHFVLPFSPHPRYSPTPRFHSRYTPHAPPRASLCSPMSRNLLTRPQDHQHQTIQPPTRIGNKRVGVKRGGCGVK